MPPVGGHNKAIPLVSGFFTIKAVSAANVPDPRGGNKAALPEFPPPGTGTLKLADFCTQYDVSIQLIIRELKKKASPHPPI
jgi:hypothetical protein